MSGLAGSVFARVERQRDLLAALSEHCHAISVRVTSRDGSVSVEVDGLGAMTGLWLRPHASQLGPKALAKLIIDTAEAASRVCVDRQNYLVTEFNRRMRAIDDTPLTGVDDTTVTDS